MATERVITDKFNNHPYWYLFEAARALPVEFTLPILRQRLSEILGYRPSGAVLERKIQQEYLGSGGQRLIVRVGEVDDNTIYEWNKDLYPLNSSNPFDDPNILRLWPGPPSKFPGRTPR